LKHNTKLEQLNCGINKLTLLDLSNNPEIYFLRCNDNKLSVLDLRKNPNIQELVCYNNELITLNIQNRNNHILYFMWTDNNKYLKCIQVDNIAFAKKISNGEFYKEKGDDHWVIDDGVYFSKDCYKELEKYNDEFEE